MLQLQIRESPGRAARTRAAGVQQSAAPPPPPGRQDPPRRPAKRAEGRAKTRLGLDPDRAPVVEQMFTWRIAEGAGYRQLASRRNADPRRYPPPAGLWSRDTWRQAQQGTGRPRPRHGHGPATARTYVLRGYIRCAICGRTFKGITTPPAGQVNVSPTTPARSTRAIPSPPATQTILAAPPSAKSTTITR